MIVSSGKALLVGPVAAAMLALGVSAIARADDSLQGELQRCASVAEATERLACYDQLAGRDAPVLAPITEPEPVAAPPAKAAAVITAAQEPAPVRAPKPAPVAPKTLDDIDAETVPRSTTDEQDELLVRARVTRCEKDARKKYYFVFDNGQVWKQVSDKRLRYRECEFDVTITKDFFGYKMQVDGEKGRVRIDRIK